MDVAVRAKRILMALANYHAASNPTDWRSMATCMQLGELIGCYQNGGESDDVVGIFAHGVAWYADSREIVLRFADIENVLLPNAKQSTGLLLKTRDGRLLHIPITGQKNDRFYDSMEVLRFFMRVLKDLR